MSAVIAIVGRPNVGKSTLFNRIAKKRIAITSDVAGTTRDRIMQATQLQDLDVNIVDTGGLESETETNIENDVQSQAKIGIADANLILFVVDGTQEPTLDDFLAADILRKSNKEVILVVNKCDNQKIEQLAFNFYELGFDDPITISAAHKIGIDQLLDRAHDSLKKQGFTKKTKEKSPEEPLAISILGRPNVGKSSLVNALCGKNKVIVSDVAGTTRDATDTVISYHQKPITLIDTAGIRRRGKIEKGIERFSIIRCFDCIDRSDVCVLVIDYNEGISKQDMHILEFILNKNKGLILVVNKCDLMEDPEEDRKRFSRYLGRKFTFIPWTSVIFISAKERKNIQKIFDISQEILIERQKRVSTGEFNSFLKKVTHKHLPSGNHKTPPKILYAAQTGINPPQFTFIMNDPQLLHFSYRRYLENEIRKEYGFNGTGIDMIFRKRKRRDLKKGIATAER